MYPDDPYFEEINALEEIAAHPDDETRREAYAGWLERRGDPRGKFLRLESEVASGPASGPEYLRRLTELQRLAEEIDGAWRRKVDRSRLQRVVEFTKRAVGAFRENLRDNNYPADTSALVELTCNGRSEVRFELVPIEGIPAGTRIWNSHGLFVCCHEADVEALQGTIFDYVRGYHVINPNHFTDETTATNPARLKLSHTRVEQLYPGLFPAADDECEWEDPVIVRAAFATLEDHLWRGDARAAVVMSVAPLIVAAYSDELDCVAMVSFSRLVNELYSLSVGDHLVSVNSYPVGARRGADLSLGPRAMGNYVDFSPLIGDFVTDDQSRIAHLRAAIAQEEWNRSVALGEHRMEYALSARDGMPLSPWNLVRRRSGQPPGW